MPQAARQSEARSRIVAAARRLVARAGVHSSTMRGIAREAGVSTGAVTHYFADKAAVMDAVLRHNHDLATRRVVAAVEGARGLASITRTVEALLPTDEESLRIWTVLIAFWGHSPAQALLASGISAESEWGLRPLVVKGLRDAVSDGQIPPDSDIEGEAERILVLIAGLGFLAGGFAEEMHQVRRRTRTILARHLNELARTTSALGGEYG